MGTGTESHAAEREIVDRYSRVHHGGSYVRQRRPRVLFGRKHPTHVSDSFLGTISASLRGASAHFAGACPGRRGGTWKVIMSELNAEELQLWGGIECTINRVGCEFHNQFTYCGHTSREDDLDRIAALGIKALRYPVLWESHHGESADWTWSDRPMKRLRQLNLPPIVGLVHHGSGPEHTSLVGPQFAPGLAAHARAVAERYPWLTMFNPVNEPLTTARFSCLYGHWYPHEKSFLAFSARS
jgi:hypothetical protein